MARVVGVHGIGKQLLGEETLCQQWLPALNDGLKRAEAPERLADADVGMAFYGDVFRPEGEYLAVGDPLYTSQDVEAGFETELLLTWWKAAAESDPGVVPPDADTSRRRRGRCRAHCEPCRGLGSSPASRCGRWSST